MPRSSRRCSSPGEPRVATVRTWVLAAVDAQAALHDRRAHFFFDQRVVGFFDSLLAQGQLLGRRIGGELGHHLVAQGFGGAFAVGFVAVADGLLEAAAHPGGDLLLERAVGHRGDKLFLGLAGLGDQLELHVDDRLHGLVAFFDCFEHLDLGQLLGAGLDHHHGFFGAGHDQVKAAVFHQPHDRVDHQHAVDVAHLDRGDRAGERDVRKRQGGGCADDRQRARIVDHVGRQGRDDDLHVVGVAFGEQRAQGAVGQAGGQDGGFGRAAFALEVRPGDLAGRVHLLFVVDGQREEIDAFARLVGGGGGGQQDGVAVADQD
jgi:hypothetical protein